LSGLAHELNDKWSPLIKYGWGQNVIILKFKMENKKNKISKNNILYSREAEDQDEFIPILVDGDDADLSAVEVPDILPIYRFAILSFSRVW